MTGRGLLGKWGPNHAADPIVTRWKTDSNGERVMVDGKPCLEFVAIKRKDTGEWALPGVRRRGEREEGEGGREEREGRGGGRRDYSVEGSTDIACSESGNTHCLSPPNRGWWKQETPSLPLSRKSLARKP